MAIIQLKNVIKDIIENTLSINYLRATGPEANVTLALQDSAITSAFGIHIDQTEVTTSLANNSKLRTKTVPTEILFVYKSSSVNDLLDAVDNNVNDAEILADRFFDNLIQNDIFSSVSEIPSYNLQRVEAYKRFDTIMNGVLFTCDFPILQETYYCNG